MKFIFKKLAGFGLGFFSQWRLYTVIIAIVSTYIASIKIESVNAKRQRTKAAIELERVSRWYEVCQTSNAILQGDLQKIQTINIELVNQFNDAKKDNQKSIKELKTYENLQDAKIRKLLQKVNRDDCSDNLISDNNNKLLKQAINQD